jgi:DNA replication protein DnaC
MEELGFMGMLSVLEDVLGRLNSGELGGIDAFDKVIEHEWRYRQEKATTGRINRSKVQKGASLEDFDLTLKRTLSKGQLRDLSTLEWCDDGRPLILVGSTGVGKTFLARSLGLLACEKGKTVLFYSITDFIENLKIARQTDGYLKFRLKLTRPDLLILDDFGMRKLTSQESEDLRDIIEQRSYGRSTLITTQLPFDHWSEVIGDEIVLDALVDRLESPGWTVKIKGPSYRPELKKKLDAKTG